MAALHEPILWRGTVKYDNFNGFLTLYQDEFHFESENDQNLKSFRRTFNKSSQFSRVKKSSAIVIRIDDEKHVFIVTSKNLESQEIEYQRCYEAILKLISLRNNISTSIASPTVVTHSIPQSTSPNISKDVDHSNSSRQTIPKSKRDIFLQVSVSDPSVHNETVTYLIKHRTNIEEYAIKEGEVRRRYSQFDQFFQLLISKFGKFSSIPFLPAKSWTKRLEPDFLSQRATELDAWLKKISCDEYIRQSVELCQFLTEPKEFNSTSNTGIIGRLWKPFVDNQVVYQVGDVIQGVLKTYSPQNMPSEIEASTSEVSSSNSSHHSHTTISQSPLERDYALAKHLMNQWQLKPKKLPFSKFVTLLLGSTSSGKSAFVNHFFGAVVRKSTDHQQDTDFTIVEVVSNKEFCTLSNTREKVVHSSQLDYYLQSSGITDIRKDHISIHENQSHHHQNAPQKGVKIVHDFHVIDDELLHRPIEDFESDWRNGRVFLRLNHSQAVVRYDQLKLHCKDGVFRACIINEAALNKMHSHFDMACNSILVDSPGFSSIQSAEISEKFMGTLMVLQYLYNMADLLLYFVPTGQISTLSQHLPLLELTITYANHGEQITTDVLHKIASNIKHNNQKESKNKNQQSYGATGLISTFLTSLAAGIIQEASAAVISPIKDMLSTTSDKSATLNQGDRWYKGSAVWNKTLFILSKVDMLLRQADPATWTRILYSQYYELGVLLGSSLTVLDPPVHDQTLVIGLPEFQKHSNNQPAARTDISYSADLSLLMAKIQARECEASYIERVENAIQAMCDDLEVVVSKAYLTSWNTLPTIRDLRSRSENRLKSRQIRGKI